ncbi:hypothetical protein KP509_25G038700 [Ceratopteris richardii]|uniref:cytokinin dehydrogenase n=1 Tax=Ceratopteris richardii TaxID=49495 RepID=A0A8T2RS52_CERRI|nr:hypothetical protein KP509_25G038700 [Ceratopteris richardii]
MGLEPPPPSPLSSCSPLSSMNVNPSPMDSGLPPKSSLQNLNIEGSVSFSPSDLAFGASDFGNFIHHQPHAVLRPSTASDVASTVIYAAETPSLTIAARGNGHSIAGQAQARDGLVLDMRSLRGIEVCIGPEESTSYVEARGGELWIDVLEACLKQGYAPPSWPDYLYLTVGGTLQNAGVGGQSFKYGPVISNVLQLEVVTGRGEFRTCSPSSNEELFFAMLGGLGQFGIITKARILIVKAPQKVRWIRMVYAEVALFIRDQEFLINLQADGGNDGFDYIEGFVMCNNDDPVNGWGQVPFTLSDAERFDPTLISKTSGPFLYCLEVAKHYTCPRHVHVEDSMNEIINGLQKSLGYIRGLSFSRDAGYMEFLDRVHAQEKILRDLGMWQAPHPWLCLFVPRSQVLDLHDHMFLRTNLINGVGGPMHMYPMLRSKWNGRASIITPEEDIFYLVSILRSNFPPPLGPPAIKLLIENENLLETLKSKHISFKVYMPNFKSKEDCTPHFGARWKKFIALKESYDPLHILAPGQSIFSRRKSHDKRLIADTA